METQKVICETEMAIVHVAKSKVADDVYSHC